MSTTRYLLGVALAAAGLAAACGDGPSDTLGPGGVDKGGSGGDNTEQAPGAQNGGTNGGSTGGATGGGTTGGAGPTPTDPTPAPNTAAKQYFISNVYPKLVPTCATCHETGPGPAWISKTDAEVSYKMQFQRGYVTLQSPILTKGAHDGANNALTNEQTTAYTTWVQMELQAAPAGKAAPNVLDKIGACFDQTKFDAMGLGNMRTIQRTTNNNTNNVTPWNENANNCTGCNNAPCRVCHSGDDATAFVNAVGNPNLPKDYTFTNSKLNSPPYVTKYFGVSPTGDPIASDAIMTKSIATSKDKAYTHPYFTVSQTQQAAIKDFVDDAIARYKANNGNCPTTP